MRKFLLSTLACALIILTSACGPRTEAPSNSIVENEGKKKDLPPFEFRGMKLGDGQEKFKEVFRARDDSIGAKASCSKSNEKGYSSCQYRAWLSTDSKLIDGEIGFGDIPAGFMAFYVNGGLYDLDISISSSNFSEAVDMLIAKFGKPTGSEVVEVQNGIGNKFKNETIYWERDDSTLTAEKFSNSLSRSKINYSQASMFQRKLARRAAVIEKAGKI